MRALLISTYELGRQPFGIASPAAWLKRAGVEVSVADLSRTRLDADVVRGADLVALFLPMHTATRLALPVIDRVRALNPSTHICAYGLYAPPNGELLRERGVSTILGGEFEADLVALALRLGAPAFARLTEEGCRAGAPTTGFTGAEAGELRLGRPDAPVAPLAPIARLSFIAPDRSLLPRLDKYASLEWPDGTNRVVGYTEASRGCKHLCRHCPVVPIYDGRFRVVDADVVLADIRAQVEQGARHITFGDPDFFNGVGHARRIVERMPKETPGITYDVTIKIEHLLRHADHLALLHDTGCAFVTSAVESVDDEVLAKLEKGHTRADFERAAGLMRRASLPLVPTFVAFTPWTTMPAYVDLLEVIDSLDLVDHVPPVQWSIRLLIPAGSRLLGLSEIRDLVQPFDPLALAYPWRHSDPRVDALQETVADLAARGGASRVGTYEAIRAAAAEAASLTLTPTARADRHARPRVPFLTEPWYCCAEPTEGQAALI
jgi:radical SAM superfamily enzyme YgiQ (UPF0313 family)